MAKTEGCGVDRSVVQLHAVIQHPRPGRPHRLQRLRGGRLYRDRPALVGAEGGAEAAGPERRENRPSSVTMRVLMVKSCSNTSQQVADNEDNELVN